MSLRISTRLVGDVTILDLSGRINLGEGSVVLRDTVRKLLSERKMNILLNMGEVSYIDSSAVGEMVSAHTTVRNQGGKLKLLALTKKCYDLLQITKFYTLFDVFDTEDEAVASFESLVRCRCPMCGYFSRPPLHDQRLHWPLQTCNNPGCKATFIVSSTPDAQREVLLVTNVRIETYKNEYFEIDAGPPATVNFVGRLDLFSSSALQQMRTVFRLREQLLFDLRHATEIDDAGRTAFLAELAHCREHARAVVSLEGLGNEYVNMFPAGPPFYSNKFDALASLEHATDKVPWTVRIDRA
jgi:anti-sigma B factor antagonist